MQEVLAEDISARFGALRENVAVRVGGIVPAHAGEIAVGPEYGRGVGEIEGRQGFRPGYGVQEPSPEEGFAACAVREVLVHHQEVVAEIEVCLPGIAHRQGASSEVPDAGGGNYGDAESCQVYAPAEVDFLHMGEEVRVKATEGHV